MWNWENMQVVHKKTAKIYVACIIACMLYFWHFLVTRQRSCSFVEYWKHFMERLNGVHSFGYSSAGSEPIWKKFGALWVHCLPLALADFGRDWHRSERERARGNFVFFCLVNHTRFHRLPFCQISRNLHTICGSVSQWILSEQLFENFPVRGRFFPKTATFLENASTTSDFMPP